MFRFVYEAQLHQEQSVSKSQYFDWNLLQKKKKVWFVCLLFGWIQVSTRKEKKLQKPGFSKSLIEVIFAGNVHEYNENGTIITIRD